MEVAFPPFCEWTRRFQVPPENPAVLIPPLPEGPCETGAPLYPWQPRALLQGFLGVSGCPPPFPGGGKSPKSLAVFCLPPSPGTRPCCRILQCSPHKGSLSACRGRPGGCTCREMCRDVSDNGGPLWFKGGGRARWAFPRLGFLRVFQSVQRGLQEKGLPGGIAGQGLL